MIATRWLVPLLMLGLAVPAAAAPPKWIGSWATAELIAEDQNALPAEALRSATLRQVVRLSVGGKRLRVVVSNAFGTAPMTVAAVHVARSAGADRIDPASDRRLTFAGATTMTIPAGASLWSDPVDLDVPPLARLAVTMHLRTPPARQTGHPGSRTTSFLLAGDHAGKAELPDAQRIERWYQLAGIEVESTASPAAIVAFGDSITDGHGVTTDRDERWPDRLAERLQERPATRGIAVLNMGIGGNRLLDDGIGPNALARLDRDVLARPGVRWLIVLEGINDIGMLTRDGPRLAADHAAHVARIIAAHRQVVARARAHGIRVVGGTLLPFGGSGYYRADRANEADRQAVNRWIRAPGHYDAVIDFDAAVRDPAQPERMLPAYDVGDHLHPSPAGYRAMADAIPLALFKSPGGRSSR